MRLLLDTHILLWQTIDDPRLTRRIVELLTDPANEKIVSDVSLCELAIKTRIGKLDLRLADMEGEIEFLGYTMLPIRREHIRSVPALPKAHGDPFDHLLIAQGLVEDLTILTTDRWFREYPVRSLPR